MTALDEALKKLDDLRVEALKSENDSVEKDLYDIQQLIFKHQDSADQRTASLKAEIEKLKSQPLATNFPTDEEIEEWAEKYADQYRDYGNHKHGAIAGAKWMLSRLQENTQEGWISVKDRLPKDYERILFYEGGADNKLEDVGYFVPSQSKIPDYVTHWRPLPLPPSSNH